MGGLGTLIAVCISTKVANDTFKATLLQHTKEFTDKIAEDIGMYISCISDYAYDYIDENAIARSSKISANAMYYSLKNKLNDVPSAQDLLAELTRVQRDVGQQHNASDNTWVQQNADKLAVLCGDFSKDYIGTKE